MPQNITTAMPKEMLPVVEADIGKALKTMDARTMIRHQLDPSILKAYDIRGEVWHHAQRQRRLRHRHRFC